MLKCKHTETRTHRWVETDGTLMLHKSCLQCGITLDKGHVYGEDDGKWSGVIIEESAQHRVRVDTLKVHDMGEVNGVKLTYVDGNVFATPSRR